MPSRKQHLNWTASGTATWNAGTSTFTNPASGTGELISDAFSGYGDGGFPYVVLDARMSTVTNIGTGATWRLERRYAEGAPWVEVANSGAITTTTTFTVYSNRSHPQFRVRVTTPAGGTLSFVIGHAVLGEIAGAPNDPAIVG